MQITQNYALRFLTTRFGIPSLLRTTLLISSIVFCAITLSAAPTWAQESKTFVIGTTVGDFADMVKESLKPLLEKKGFEVKLVQFTDYVQPNIALSEKSLDANLFQHRPYLEEFSKAKGLKLSPLSQVPTAPLGLYAGKKKSLAEVSDGVTVAVPNDPTNLARALRIIADLGWIELPQKSAEIQVTPRDITKNVKNVKIIQLEAAQLPRATRDVDYAIINGNYAVSSGLALTSALAQEKSDAYVNWIVVRTEDVSSAKATALKDAASSPEFKKYAREKFKGYKFPAAWK